MEVNNTSSVNQDGVEVVVASVPAPSSGERIKVRPITGNRKRRRGKHKRKVTKPFVRPRQWSCDKRRAAEERLRRVRPKPVNEAGAPYNNNQFLMEIHAPEAEPRTRDSSFSVDSEDNYLYSLPENEMEFLTKEFSSVYEDAACERLAGLTKAELLQEYLALEARYQSVSRGEEAELRLRLREREQQVRELELENEKLRQQVERLRQQTNATPSSNSESSADSESDSSSSLSSPHSSRPASPLSQSDTTPPVLNGHCETVINGNGVVSPVRSPLCNGHLDSESVQ